MDRKRTCPRTDYEPREWEFDSLETENAMLHLKIVKLVGELKNQSEKVTYLNNKIGDLLRERQKWKSWLVGVHASLSTLKDDYEELRNAVETLPTDVQSECREIQKLVRDKSDSLRQSTKGMEFEVMQEQLGKKDDELQEMLDKLNREKRKRKLLHNTVMELKGNIRVHCRVRPVVECDHKLTGYPIPIPGRYHFSPSKAVEPVVTALDEEVVAVKTGRSCKTFECERVFGPQDSQEVVFEEVKPLVTSLLDGYNVCVMAYGQTGSGKTHTMMGFHDGEKFRLTAEPRTDEGIFPRAVRELFSLTADKPYGMHTVEMSIVEIYNNDLRDLMVPANNLGRHDIVLGVDGEVHLPTITYRPMENVGEVMQYILQALHHRSEGSTKIHDHSSRSHLIVMLTVTTVPHLDRNVATAASAASTTAAATGHAGFPAAALKTVSSKEGGPSSCSPTKRNLAHSAAHPLPLTPPSPTKRRTLNHPATMSLPPLSPTARRSQIPRYTATAKSRSPSPLRKSILTESVVRTKLQLVDLAGSECVGMSGATGEQLRETAHINRSLCSLSDVLGALAENRNHVPYRNSKLTHFLQDSIGGDAKLLILLCVSPTRRQVAESLQTLAFGQRARQVQRGQIRKRSSSAPGGGLPNGDMSSPKPLRARSLSLKAL